MTVVLILLILIILITVILIVGGAEQRRKRREIQKREKEEQKKAKEEIKRKNKEAKRESKRRVNVFEEEYNEEEIQEGVTKEAEDFEYKEVDANEVNNILNEPIDYGENTIIDVPKEKIEEDKNDFDAVIQNDIIKNNEEILKESIVEPIEDKKLKLDEDKAKPIEEEKTKSEEEKEIDGFEFNKDLFGNIDFSKMNQKNKKE